MSTAHLEHVILIVVIQGVILLDWTLLSSIEFLLVISQRAEWKFPPCIMAPVSLSVVATSVLRESFHAVQKRQEAKCWTVCQNGGCSSS